MPSALEHSPPDSAAVNIKSLDEPSSPALLLKRSGRLTNTIDIATTEISSQILEVIDRYRLRTSSNISSQADQGAIKFLATIYSHVKLGATIPLCLPAFPFKSPNRSSKVLGTLPDRGEALALAHLNGLCQAIGDVYPPGANLTIISDGLVYNGKHGLVP
jgi:pyoverdine/dityrosine biosynthesis protein Dit1